MKIDHDYLKKLLEAFEAAPAPIVNILELQAAGLDYDNDQFVFQMSILDDQRFVERDDREPGFGLTGGLDGHMSWSALPLRVDTGKAILRDYIKATVGFEKLSQATGTQPKSLIRMFGVAKATTATAARAFLFFAPSLVKETVPRRLEPCCRSWCANGLLTAGPQLVR